MSNKMKINSDNSDSSSNNNKVNKNAKQDQQQQKSQEEIHTPYILNGELYKIISRNGENVTVKCCHCPPDRVYRGSVRSTGNFHMHIKRRHADLLGKLHDMKVAAILERRDRLMKNRKKPKTRQQQQKLKKATQIMEKQRELKIKTVFQRHQQEQQLGAAAVCESSICETTQRESTSSGENRSHETNESDNGIDDVPNAEVTRNDIPSLIAITTQSNNAPPPLTAISLPASYTLAPPIIGGSTAMLQQQSNPFISSSSVGMTSHSLQIDNSIKPEQTAPLSSTTQAIDLTVNNNTTTGTWNGVHVDVPATMVNMSGAGVQSFSAFDLFRTAFMRIDGTLRSIQEELHTRNQIESNRIMLDLATFKYLYPEFSFQFNVSGTH